VIRIVVVDDHTLFRRGIIALLSQESDFAVVGEAADGFEGIRTVLAQRPDVVLLDLNMPGISGVEALGGILKEAPDTHVVMLTVSEDADDLVDTLRAGASGYLLKKTPPARLLESLKEAVAGGAPMSPEVARRVISLFREIRPPERADYDLTPHETRLLKLFARGHNYKTAAAELGVSVHTIDFHLRSIYGKLQVHSKTEAVAIALRNRLV
jgi:two-component system nitrate/nitrite response regulator NarL